MIEVAHSPGFLKLVEDAKTRIKEVSIGELVEAKQKNESFFLVDTREESEWTASRIEGAIHLGKGVIERDIEASIPDPNAKVILYCGGGFRSALAADNLQKMGYTDVYSLAGGIREWKKEHPVVTD